MNREFKLKKEAQRVIDQELIGWDNPQVISIYDGTKKGKRKIMYVIRLEGDENYGKYLQI